MPLFFIVIKNSLMESNRLLLKAGKDFSVQLFGMKYIKINLKQSKIKTVHNIQIEILM